MRMLRTGFVLIVCSGIAIAQWTQVNTGLTNTAVTTMLVWEDTVMVGTDGGGIFKSIDHGDTWTDISGNIGNRHINRIMSAGMSTVLFAATDAGVYYTEDHATYVDNTKNLSTTDAAYYWLGDTEKEAADWLVGTNGGGLFTGPEKEGPWSPTNDSLSDAGLVFNDIGGYSQGNTDFMVMATNGGVYFSSGDVTNWTAKNTGLTGDALLVKKLAGAGSLILIATRNGLFYSLDWGDTWTNRIANEKLNTVFFFPSNPISVYAFGEKGFYSTNWFDYAPVDMGGVSGGEIISAATNSTYIFIGTETGGVFRRPIAEPAPSPVGAAFSASPASGDAPLTVQFTDLSTTSGNSADPGGVVFNKSNPSAISAITSWSWDFDGDDVEDADTPNPSFTYDTPGHYTVSLTVSDGTNEDTETRTDLITVTDPTAPKLTADFSADTTTGELPLTVEFLDKSVAFNTSITSWAWDFNNDNIVDATTQNASYTYPQAGTYTVKLSITDGTLMADEMKTHYITVTEPVPQLLAGFSAAPKTGMAPLTVQFTDTSQAENTVITTWSWDFYGNGTEDADGQNPVHTYATAGTYTVVLTVGDGTITDTETRTGYITVSAVVPKITAGFTADTLEGFVPFTVQFTDTSRAEHTSITTWSWDLNGNGTEDADGQNPVHTYATSGTYTVALTVGDGSLVDTATTTGYIRVIALDYPPQLAVSQTYAYPRRDAIKEYQSGDYRLFGVPGNSGKLLGDFLGGEHVTDWQAYYDNGADANYLVKYDKENTAFTLTTGSAFWLLHQGPVTVTEIVASSTLTTSHKAVIALHDGWNLITNPFPASLDWQEVKSENGLANPIYTYNGAFSLSATFDPFQGYYYLNTNPAKQEIYVPYYAAVTKVGATSPFPEFDTALHVRLHTAGDAESDIVLGFSDRAQAGRDRLDYLKPHAFDDSPDMYVNHPDRVAGRGAFYSDIRPPGNPIEVWTFEVANMRHQSAELHFNWVGGQTQADDKTWILRDRSNGTCRPITTGKPYAFVSKYDRTRFSVYHGAPELIEQVTAAMPEAFALSQNYPNPFNLQTRFVFATPRQTALQVHVHNALGQRIRTLHQGVVDAGYHRFEWDGRTDTEQEAPTGLYILTVFTDVGGRFSNKIMLLK